MFSEQGNKVAVRDLAASIKSNQGALLQRPDVAAPPINAPA